MSIPVERHETKTGVYWLPTNAKEDAIISYMVDDQIFDEAIYKAAAECIKPGSVVFDVGTCYGQMSVLFSKLVGPAGQVIGVEASPDMYSLYMRNLQENDCKNVKAIHRAAWDVSGQQLHFMDYDFSHYKSYGCFGIDPSKQGSVKVRTTTIDDICPKDKQVSLIKIDVQGADLHAMRGAIETIKLYRPSIIFEYEGAYDLQFEVRWQDYLDFIDKIGYYVHRNVNDWNFLIKPR